MDLGCLDLGCISVSDKNSTDPCNKGTDATETVTSATKRGKSKSPKGSGQSTLNALNKFTSQIKKPPRRKNSPINWFPRKKVDSYLNRKIKMLQEVDGMKLTLDETLGDSNPHYSRVLREKMAAREAAQTAMEARKAALVEASWCKILRAARIQRKEAEELLLKAEKTAAEALETATVLGVIMYDKPNYPPKHPEIETSEVNGGRSTTHTVTASFETAFEVDKEVATAIRTAFIRFASCPSFNKDEFKELLCKISQNPDMDDNNNNKESSEFSSECESESGSEVELASEYDGFDVPDKCSKLSSVETRKSRRRQSLEKFNMTKLVDMMLERLRSLKEDELSSLATIVATCGLNAALAEEESGVISRRKSSAGSAADYAFSRRMSNAGSAMMGHSNAEQIRRKQVESELPSLDKFLVKHMSKLEREVQEAKNSRKSTNRKAENVDKNADESSHKANVPNLGSILVKKHSSKLEKEIEEAKRNPRKSFEYTQKKPVSDTSEAGLESVLLKHSSKLEKEVQEMRKNFEKAPKTNGNEKHRRKENVAEVPSLDKFLVKRMSRLEKEVQDAKNRRTENVNNSSAESQKDTIEDTAKENIDKNLNAGMKGNQSKHGGNTGPECESLDKVLIKHVSKLEKEKLEFSLKEEEVKISGRNKHVQQMNEEGSSLDQILVKHKSKLEREKLSSSSSSSKQGGEEEEIIGHRLSRKEARERELQEAWGGLGLGNSIKPHLSRLERDKAAWIKAEEEERRGAVEKL
ncbi:uncharacterized protein [Euphorbia lathyris]|uniref:uncharacterized protein n=1 Tax=Euphorbia lathyris TaxID=212925 RepID=UPI0033142BC0